MYLLDTDTVIYGLKNVAKVVENYKAKAEAPKSISVISYGELIYGAKRSGQPTRNLAVVRHVADLFPVIEVSRTIMEVFGDLKAELGSRGNTVDDFDLVIAATAISYNYCLVTNNEKHFKMVPGLKLENWSR